MEVHKENIEELNAKYQKIIDRLNALETKIKDISEFQNWVLKSIEEKLDKIYIEK